VESNSINAPEFATLHSFHDAQQKEGRIEAEDKSIPDHKEMPTQIQIQPLCQNQPSNERTTTQTGQSATPESESNTANIHMTAKKNVENFIITQHVQIHKRA
jgi:hypothetical protein